jgi:UDP-glucose 4-epimerase
MRVTVTGGLGYIGSHVAAHLLRRGYEVQVLDNLENSTIDVVDRISRAAQRDFEFFQVDVADNSTLVKLLAKFRPDAVIHLAGKKSVAESIAEPLSYYEANINSTLSLLSAMERTGVSSLVFSSSATVYGDPVQIPIPETHPVGIHLANPYGRTKYFLEQIIADHTRSRPHMSANILRYFNPIGADASGHIGEDPTQTPTNLAPYVAKVAAGLLPHVEIYGTDYPTLDGTGVRDYIHVADLAAGHAAALEHLSPGVNYTNLGTGTGTSVQELIHVFEKISGRPIPVRLAPRRAGDIASAFADVTKARQAWGWQAQKSVETAVRDAWNWQSRQTGPRDKHI